jgi:predicted membrane protein (TIGR00267 family)
MLDELRLLFRILRARSIARRYLVTNGFDGGVAMLGLLMGFRVGPEVTLEVVVGACLATAVALGMSGLTSAYISEAAEKQKELRELETAMLADLEQSAHGRAARLMPVAIALVNGLSPFVIALLIMLPLWLGGAGVEMPLPPLDASIAVAFAAAFLLGVFVGTISETFWLWAGLRATAVAGATAALILLLAPR